MVRFPVSNHKTPKAAVKASTTQIGVPGLVESGGTILEELHPRLRGRQAMRIFEEMSQNDSTIGAGLYSIEGFLRRTKGTLKPGTGAGAREWADFVQTCMEDTERPWSDFQSDCLSMLWAGFSLHEILYKYRRGPESASPRFRSKYTDGKIGWRGIDLRAQTTICRWDIDREGTILGCWQETDDGEVYLPMDRCLLFRTKTYKNNPEGRSVLRGAYRSWHFKKRLEEVEAVGLVRNIQNIPKMTLPMRIMASDASDAEKAVRAQYERMVSLMARDQLTGLVLPPEVDEQDHPTGYKFELVGTTGTPMPIDPTIRRLDSRMMMSLAAEFLLLGTEKTGSFALAAEKATNFIRSLEWYADVIADQINIAIQRLMIVNGVPPENWPTYVPDPIAEVDIKDLSMFVSMISAGGFLSPTLETENALRQKGQLPEIDEAAFKQAQKDRKESVVKSPNDPEPEPESEDD